VFASARPTSVQHMQTLCCLLFAHNLLERIEGARPRRLVWRGTGSMAVAFRIGSAQPDIPAILLGLRLFE
jgi:hypothetical protein